MTRRTREAELALLASLRGRHAEITQQLEAVSSHWGFEDPVYRFYHQSFKLYLLQKSTEMAVRYSNITEPPQVLPSGYAALLYLYDLR